MHINSVISKKASVKKITYLLLLSMLLLNSFSCKKDTAAPAYTYDGKWTVTYNFTTGTMVKGSFTPTLKSNGKWDYVEGSSGKIDAGTWSSSGSTMNFVFNFSGLASYTGTKITDNSLSGTTVADGGTSNGTWIATR